MDRFDFIETREDIIQNIKTLSSYLKGEKGIDYKVWATEKMMRGKNFVVEIIGSDIYFAPSRFVGYIDNSKEKHDNNHGDGTQTDEKIKAFYIKTQDSRLNAIFQSQATKLGISSGEKKFWIPKDMSLDDIIKTTQRRTQYLLINDDAEKYWHLQMHMPDGKDGDEIDPTLMLLEAEPIIGTGEWDNPQCRNFKSLSNGSIILVRKGNQAIALCQIIGESFNDNELCNKYINVNFRKVTVLAWADSYTQPRPGLFSQGTLSHCGKDTEQGRYIRGWIKHLNDMIFTEKCANLLKSKHNIILQGAPGTGKTFNTAAIALCALGIKDVDLTDHAAVMTKYKELQNDRIFFTTFHQSLDYEDFVEGLKPHIQTNDNGDSIGITYEPESGIFKLACDAVTTDETKDILKCIDDFLKDIRGYENKVEIPTVTGRSSLYVWWKEGNTTISCRSKNSTSPKDEDYTPSPLNIAKVKLQASGKGCENNWQQYAQAFINAVKRKYYHTSEKSVVLIIDEINRGNVSKIFGELITLLESDKRENGAHPITVTLPYSKTLFSIPSNLYIIGTMNTTDRSTGTLDYALRRRFAFVTIQSDPTIVEKHYDKLGNYELKTKAVELFKDIRSFITAPKHLCGDYDVDDLMVGHSYFMASSEDELMNKVQYEIIPLISEYINDGILNVSNDEKRIAFNAWENLQTTPDLKSDDTEEYEVEDE